MNMRSYIYTGIFSASLALAILLTLFISPEQGPAVMAALLLGLVVFAGAWRRTDLMLILAVGVLIAMPFFLGVNRKPKLFLDELPLLLMLGLVPLKMIAYRSMHLKPGDLFLPLIGLIMLGMTLVYNPPDNVGLRTFVETFVLGVLAGLLCSEMADEPLTVKISVMLCVLVMLIAVAAVLEVAVNANPLMEYATKTSGDEYTYISPQWVELTGGVYRPYVVFFHPSEGATVVGLCLPFIAALFTEEKYRRIAGLALIFGLIYIVINATRGVWASLAVTAFIFLPQFRRLAILMMPLALVGLILLSLIFPDSAYFERIADLRNLRIRFFYWDIALSHLENNWFLGIGYNMFSKIYLALNPMIPTEFIEDVSQVATVDNTILMILVEQGVVGLIGFILICAFLFQRLRLARRTFLAEGRNLSAAFARAGLAVLCVYICCGLLADVHLFTKATKLFFILTGLAWGAVRKKQEM